MVYVELSGQLRLIVLKLITILVLVRYSILQIRFSGREIGLREALGKTALIGARVSSTLALLQKVHLQKSEKLPLRGLLA